MIILPMTSSSSTMQCHQLISRLVCLRKKCWYFDISQFSKDMSQDKNNPPISSNQRLVTKLIMNYLKIQQVDYDKFQNRATLGIN